MSLNWLSALRNLLEPNEIIADSEPLLIDQRGRYHGAAELVIQPNSVDTVCRVMRFCFEHRIPITPQGGNTGLCGGAVPNHGVLLNMSKLNRIRSIDLADSSITVEAGAILHDVQQAADAVGRLFPLSLASEGTCQIGGNIACNAGGVNVLRYGPMRDLVRELEVVLPDGTLVSHLSPLHKNTTGYDLKQLFIGSEGTLGIITAATLKLFPRPSVKETAWIGVPTIGAAVALLTALQSRFAERVSSFELVSEKALMLSADYSQLAAPFESPWHILVELTDSISDGLLGELLAEFLVETGHEHAVLAQSEADRQHLWSLRENISAAQKRLGTSIKHDIAVPIAHVANFIDRCGAALQQAFTDIEIVVFGHLGDGSLHYNTFFADLLNNDVYQREEEVNRIVYHHVVEENGTIAAEHGVGQVKNHWLPMVRSDAEIALMRAIKAHLDPYNIVNPGKLLPPKEQA